MKIYNQDYKIKITKSRLQKNEELQPRGTIKIGNLDWKSNDQTNHGLIRRIDSFTINYWD